ncbi:MAG: phosphoribosylglycinamide formyltransferase [Polyangiaceae bacterium]
MARLKLGVLISGRGSNLQAVLDAIASGTLDAEVCLVISNRPAAAGLARAEAAGVPHAVVDHTSYPDRRAFDQKLATLLQSHGVEWVILAGFMRIVTEAFLEHYENRVVNIHPSLLPSFVGLDAQQQALDYGVRVTGCTVHLVDAKLDAGPILAQAVVPVLAGDTRARLSTRLLPFEHALLVKTLQWIAEERLTIANAGAPGRVPVEIRGVQATMGVGSG